MAFREVEMKDLVQGDRIKHMKKIGKVRAVWTVKDKVDVMVEWEDGGVSTAVTDLAWPILKEMK